jgi:hypothetical protein
MMIHNLSCWRLPLLPLLMLLGARALPARAGKVDFNREVRPILSRYCFACHGPDDKARKGKLRLDVREGILGKSRLVDDAIVTPGKPEHSELITRIFLDDPTEVMPPPRTKKHLSEAEKQILKRWVAQGAEYTQHWAFVAPRPAPLPVVREACWPRNPIDVFVLARLEEKGLRPSPEADRYTLVRRVYLDLIGLPPTPEEADAFVHDPAPDAYARLVDRLLASPAYGERWARRWLDLARYADTNGYEKDRPRSIWPYRDWLIHALNADMPFDRFTIEQLAGDMLPGAGLSQRIATGFHRNTMINEEGGIDPLEFRYYAMTDRVATTGTVWLGLTLGCAQCHSHKYDPISQQEYYEVLAFLNNADELEMEVPTPEVREKRQEIEKKIAELEEALPARFPSEAQRERKFQAWLARERDNAIPWTVLRPVEARSNLPRLEVLDDASVLASGDQSKRDIYTLKYSPGNEAITGLRLEALPHESLPKKGPGRAYYEGPRGDFFLSELTLTVAGKQVRFQGATETYARAAIGRGKSGAALTLDGNPHTGWSTARREGEAHQAVYVLAEPLQADTFTLQLLFDRHYSAGLGRFRVSVTTSTKLLHARDIPPDIEALLAKPASEIIPEDLDRLRTYHLSVAPELARFRAEIAKLRERLPEYPTTLVFRERPADYPRPTFFHKRGEFLQPTERVQPGVPAILPPFPEKEPGNRLTFARWLVDPDNPLVSRVVMNRHWSAFFGRGIVATPEDFGLRGDLPTHPQLLDWLALEFIRSGWSIKRMHRLIVTSATYQQSSRVTPELLEADPNNLWLARGPRQRLEAELIRDLALRASGLATRALGGPSVFPPQPAGVTTEGTYGKLAWKVSTGRDRYRRGLYTFSKRTAPFAMFSTFDAPSGEACEARRESTNTPLQALTMLNDVALVEAAQALGQQTTAREGSDPDRFTFLFRRVLTRLPTAEEQGLLLGFYQVQKERFRENTRNSGEFRYAAQALAGPGEGPLPERAAWTALARVLFNLDETITKE